MSISLHTCSATVILISSVWRHMALVSFTSMWSWLAVLLLKLDNKQPKQGWIWYQEWGTKKWNIGFYVGIFLEMYSTWDFWTKKTGLALKTSVFATETTLDSVFHLLAYKLFFRSEFPQAVLWMGNKQLLKEWKLRHRQLHGCHQKKKFIRYN